MKDGIGMISTESGVLKQTPYSVGTRFGGQPVTSPEELIAAAHAGCFSMTLSAELDKAGLVPENIRTAAGLTMERLENGWTVTQIHLDVTVKLLIADRDKFEVAANAAKAGCTVSRLLNTKITMDAKLESAENFTKTTRKPDLIPPRTSARSSWLPIGSRTPPATSGLSWRTAISTLRRSRRQRRPMAAVPASIRV